MDNGYWYRSGITLHDSFPLFVTGQTDAAGRPVADESKALHPPQVAHFAAGDFDFTLVNLHLTFAGGNTSESAREMRSVLDYLDAYFNLPDHDPDVLVCGDFNTPSRLSGQTGSGGITAVPLITKGRAEADGSVVDMNYFLGIRTTDNVLVADFEEGTGQTSPGLNHPVAGTTAIVNGVWYHAAATYDGTTWRLYLNGNLEATLVVGASRLPQSLSTQHAGLGTAMTSAGAAAGFFAGIIDEARVWNVERTQAQIQGAMASEVLAAPGLIARWGLNEGAGASAGNSIAGSVDGTLTNGPVWTEDATVPLATEAGLRFGGTNAYVTFGNPAALTPGRIRSAFL